MGNGLFDLSGRTALVTGSPPNGRTATLRGEMAFGALETSLELAYGWSDVSFDWEGSDDMHEVSGSGSAELLEDASLEIEFELRPGDELILKAERVTSSAAR